MSNRDNQIQKYFDIDSNGRLTPERNSPTKMGPGRYPEGGGLSLVRIMTVFLLWVAVLSFIFMLLFGGG